MLLWVSTHMRETKKTPPPLKKMDFCMESLVQDVAIDVFNAFVDTCRQVLGSATLSRSNVHALHTPFITSTQDSEQPLHHFRSQCLKMRSEGDAHLRHLIGFLARQHHCSYRHIEDLWSVIYMQLVRLSYVNPYLFHAFDHTDNCTEGVAACQKAIWFTMARAIQWEKVDTPRRLPVSGTSSRATSVRTSTTATTAKSHSSQRSGSLMDHIRNKVAASVAATERSYEDQPIKLRVNLEA